MSTSPRGPLEKSYKRPVKPSKLAHVVIRTARFAEGWIAAASGPTAYAHVHAFIASIFGRLIVFGYTWALFHHLFSGIRHFVWDLGYGFKASEREALTWGALIAGITATVLLWIVAYAIGGGR